MFDEHSHNKRTFYSAPQSVMSFVAAVLEPVLTVLVFLLANVAVGEPIDRPVQVLCFLVVALTFPGRNRFRENLLVAATEISLSWVTVILILYLCGYATQSLQLFDRVAVLAWILTTPVLQWVSVWVGQLVVGARAMKPKNRRSAIIVGAGALGVKIARSLNENHHQGIDFIGFFEDRTGDRVQIKPGDQILGGLKRVAQYVSEQGIQEVYITLPLGQQPRIVELLDRLQGTTASLFFVPDVFGISIIQGRLEDMNGIPVVGICETPFTGTNALTKRVSDIVLSIVILTLIAPLLVAIAIGVKISSAGPVIFRQKRNGLAGEKITVYKFRSMTTQDNGPVVKQATKGDARVTRFGAFIRRTSLDELPQFINVLQGRMSIVGPRPHAVAHNDEYRQLIKAYMVRHKVRPGITGWAQVNGHRGETNTIEKMRARVEYDLEYLRNWSLSLDMQILVRTIRLVFFDRNAY